MGRARRRLNHRRGLRRGESGSAAVEMALTLPVWLGICGFMIIVGHTISVRYQMLEFTHLAVTSCASASGSSVQSIKACVGNQARASAALLNPVCTVAVPGPQVTLLPLRPTSGASIYTVTQQMTCAFQLDLQFLSLLLGGAPRPFTVAASSTAPFIPAN